MDSLVSTAWLAADIGASDLKVVDASSHLAATGRNAAAEYALAHIPGALFLDLGTLVDNNAPVETTLPDADQFAERMRSLGIGPEDRIVLYDDSANKSSARAWYMFRLFGLANLAVLDGGLGKWKAEGRQLAAGVDTPQRGDFALAEPDRGRLRSKADVLANIAAAREQLLDARSAARFTGEEQETRAGLASGHIPGSRHLHYATLYNADGTLRDEAQLAALFAAAGIDSARPVTTTCGSGVTACALAFALHRLGRDDAALYDGSWTEWGSDPLTPKATGPA